MEDEERTLTVVEAAARLHVGPHMVRRWIHEGHLEGTPVGGIVGSCGYRIPEESVRALEADMPALPT